MVQVLPSGYASFSDLLASDDELQVYRKFRRLSARNLLYLQSELRALEDELYMIDQQDLREERAGELKTIAQCFDTLQHDSDSRPRLEIIMRIRAVMRDYHKALLLESQVLKLSTPSDRIMKVLTGNGSLWQTKPLVGLDLDLLDDLEDLAALKPATGEDRLSIFLQDHCGRFFKSKQDGNVGYFPEKSIIVISNAVAVVSVAVLLIGAVSSLSAVRNSRWRLVLLAAFTTTFAIAVSTLTNARRAEIFAATAAYSAVLVVFIGTSPPPR